VHLCVTLTVVTFELHIHDICNKKLAENTCNLITFLLATLWGKNHPLNIVVKGREIFKSNLHEDYVKTYSSVS
jgi:hypothetical protein